MKILTAISSRLKLIEEPRGKSRGFFDPSGICIFAR